MQHVTQKMKVQFCRSESRIAGKKILFARSSSMLMLILLNYCESNSFSILNAV